MHEALRGYEMMDVRKQNDKSTTTEKRVNRNTTEFSVVRSKF